MNKLSAIVISILILLTCSSHEYSVPDLHLYDVDSNLVSLHDLIDEGPVFMCAWATWSPPCVQELDALTPYYDELVSYDIQMLAVTLEEYIDSVMVIVEEHEWEYMILFDFNREIDSLYPINAIPTTLIIDQNGDIVFDYVGFGSGFEVTIVDTLRYLFGD